MQDYASEQVDAAFSGVWPLSTVPVSYSGSDFGTLKYINGYYLWPYSVGNYVRILYKRNWKDAWKTTENVTSSILKEIYYVGDYYVLTENSSSATYAVYSKDFKNWFTGTVPAPYGNLTVGAGIVQVGDSLYGTSCSVSGYTATMKLWKMSANSISSGFTVIQTISLSTGGVYDSAYTSGSDRWFYNDVQGKYFFTFGTGGNSSYNVSIYVLDQQTDQIEAKHTFSLSGTSGMRFIDAGDCVIASTSSTYSYMYKNTLDWDAWTTFTPPTTNISCVEKVKGGYAFATSAIEVYYVESLGGEATYFHVSSTNYMRYAYGANGVILLLNIAQNGAWTSATQLWLLRDPDVGLEQISPITNISSLYGTSVSFNFLNGMWYLRGRSSGSNYAPLLYYVQATLPTITFDGASAYIKAK